MKDYQTVKAEGGEMNIEAKWKEIDRILLKLWYHEIKPTEAKADLEKANVRFVDTGNTWCQVHRLIADPVEEKPLPSANTGTINRKPCWSVINSDGKSTGSIEWDKEMGEFVFVPNKRFAFTLTHLRNLATFIESQAKAEGGEMNIEAKWKEIDRILLKLWYHEIKPTEAKADLEKANVRIVDTGNTWCQVHRLIADPVEEKPLPSAPAPAGREDGWTEAEGKAE